jgi:hypothetical protein
MRKFTVFTVVLSIVVIVIVADLVVNNYLPGLSGADVVSELTSGKFNLPDSIDPSKALETNVLGADDVAANEDVQAEITGDATAGFELNRLGFDLEKNDVPVTADPLEGKSIPPDFAVPVERSPENSDSAIPLEDIPAVNQTSSSAGDKSDFEDSEFVATSKSAVLRDEQIKSAGFVSAYLEDEQYDGSLYKTIYTDDLFDVSVKKAVIRSKDSMFAKVYVIKAGPGTSITEVYQVLKVRGAEGLDTEVNETNDFSEGSFYMNDTQRPKTAFLTVKIGGLIYGFSYPKEYHPQVKNLIKLLEWEK